MTHGGAEQDQVAGKLLSTHDDRVAELIDLHQADVLHSMETVIHGMGAFATGEVVEGQTGRIQWRRVESLGKHQPVAIMELDFPEATRVPVVFRPTQREFETLYEQYPAIQRYYPRLYARTTVPYSGFTRSLLAIEKVEGFHGDNHGIPGGNDAFYERLTDPENFEQLCREAFQMVDEILTAPIMLTDIRPAVGHNTIYNIKTGHYQFFDIDTLRSSSLSHLEKFIYFIEPGQKLDRDQEVAWTMRMLQQYIAKYPDTDLSNIETRPTKIGRYSFVEDGSDANTDGYIYPDDEKYEDALICTADYWQVQRMLRQWRREDMPTIKRTVVDGVSKTSIRPELIAAMDSDDAGAFKVALNDAPGNKKLTKQELIETAGD